MLKTCIHVFNECTCKRQVGGDSRPIFIKICFGPLMAVLPVLPDGGSGHLYYVTIFVVEGCQILITMCFRYHNPWIEGLVN